jgi:hypothetical protein
MKKIIIIAGILLLAVTAFAQQDSRERARQNDQNHKSEATARRTGQNQRIEAPAGKTSQNHTPETSVRRNTADRQAVSATRQTTQHRTSTPAVERRKVEDRQAGTSTRNTVPNRTSTPVAERRKVEDRQAGTSTRNTAPNRTSTPVAERRNDEQRRHYTTPNRKDVRNDHGVSTHYVPVKYHKVHYRTPRHVHVIWTRQMYHEYLVLYPEFRYWYYPVGYTILTVPSYNAGFYIGEVRNIYGRVYEVWYSLTTDEYYLYFGAGYPYQDFTVILSGRDARRFHRFPEAFFEGRYIWVTGLVSTWEGKPEIMVKRNSQVHLY